MTAPGGGGPFPVTRPSRWRALPGAPPSPMIMAKMSLRRLFGLIFSKIIGVGG